MKTYDHELTLIKEGYIEDDIGNQIPGETKQTVLCRKMSVGRNEFYAAATSKLKPEIIFVIHGYEYEGERKVEFEGQRYTVLRTYAVDFEEIELTCGRGGADG